MSTLTSKEQGQPGTSSSLLALSQHHPRPVGPYLERMWTEDSGTVAAEVCEVVEEAATQ
jgi:hypothetical protein